jgi:GntR family transcriptional regulator
MVDPLLNEPGVPRYIQIREALRQQIQVGSYAAGKPIPPEKELATRYGVSRMTVRHAIDGLVDDGLLYRKQGAGTFVTHRRIPHDYSKLKSSYEMVRRAGLQAGTQLLSLEVVVAPEPVAKALFLSRGDSVVRFERLRLAAGQPVAIVCSWVPQELCPESVLDDIPLHDSLFQLLESYGLRLRRGIQTIEVRLADRAQAALLGAREGDPLVYVERTTFADDGTPVDFSQVHNRADTYTCTMVLDR